MPLRCIIVFVLLLLTGIVLAADPPELTEGIASVSAGDYARAVLLLQPIAADRPDDSVPHYWLGRAYYGERQFRAAAKHLALAANMDSGNHDVCLWHARALRAAGNGKDAAEAYAAYVERFPADNTMLAEYAKAQAQDGDYAGARNTFAQLLERDPSPATRAAIDAWNKALTGLASLAQLEPPSRLRTPQYELCYDNRDEALSTVRDAVERAQARISTLTGIKLKGYRILLFPTWATYSRYAQILLPEGSELHAAAFTLPGVLVLWSPSNWPERTENTQEFRDILRHEMTHLAINQYTGGEGLPTWLNEGLACYFGGWGGMQTGQIPAKPFSFSELDQALLRGDRDSQEQAYAQAHAMLTALARKLGTPGLFKLIDRLADGLPLATAYEQLSGEKLDKFLANWPSQSAAK